MPTLRLLLLMHLAHHHPESVCHRLGLLLLGASGAPTLWLVLRLSTCFLNTACQKSLHRNFIISSVSPSRGLSLLYLGRA
jgi:hypothetical protein